MHTQRFAGDLGFPSTLGHLSISATECAIVEDLDHILYPTQIPAVRIRVLVLTNGSCDFLARQTVVSVRLPRSSSGKASRLSMPASTVLCGMLGILCFLGMPATARIPFGVPVAIVSFIASPKWETTHYL
jgi:hypothetical protein